MNYKLIAVIASYNKGEWIEKCISSILCQKFDYEWKLIIADDGSTDITINILKKYDENYDNIEVMYSDFNQGLFKNLIRVYEHLKCDYFFVIGADDYLIDDTFFSRAIEFLDSNNKFSLYHTNANMIFPNGKEKKYLNSNKDRYTYQEWIKGTDNSGNAATIYRNVFFADGIPKWYRELGDRPEREAFRADSGLSCIHLHYGDAYYDGTVSYAYRYNYNGLFSSLSEVQKKIQACYCTIVYFDQFRDCHKLYCKRIRKQCLTMMSFLKLVVDRGEMSVLRDEDCYRVKYIIDWLKENDNVMQDYYKERAQKVHFSFDKFMRAIDNGMLIWGTSICADSILSRYSFPEEKIICYVDNDSSKWGKDYRGKPIISPQDIKKKYNNNYILVLSWHFDDIICQILQDKLSDEAHIVNLMEAVELESIDGLTWQ